MEWIHIVVGTLVVWGVTEFYSHEQIFGIRNWAIVQKESGKSNKFIEALICIFCINYWISFIVSILITYFHHNLILTFLYIFVFARCSNFLNDFFYKYSRTPGNRVYENWKLENGDKD